MGELRLTKTVIRAASVGTPEAAEQPALDERPVLEKVAA
jgi:hypothetical protein